MPDVITYADFSGSRSMGCGGVEFCPYPLTLVVVRRVLSHCHVHCWQSSVKNCECVSSALTDLLTNASCFQYRTLRQLILVLRLSLISSLTSLDRETVPKECRWNFASVCSVMLLLMMVTTVQGTVYCVCCSDSLISYVM